MAQPARLSLMLILALMRVTGLPFKLPKLKPVEIELRRIEEVVSEVVGQMEYLRTREQKLRDTNESTNERVKWFAFSIMATLVGLGAWQVVYLRAYFRSVHCHSKK